MIQRPIAAPIRANLTWEARWRGSDRGLIHCWELGRRLRLTDKPTARQAEKGEFPPLPWKGGFTGELKAKKRYATLQYLAMWQGLAGLDLSIDPDKEATLTCSRTALPMIFTADLTKVDQTEPEQGGTAHMTEHPLLTITEEFTQALAAIARGQHVFITGKAGTGKSTLLGLVGQQLSGRNVAVVAPTGVAALNVDGLTLHKFFAFRPSLTTSLEKYRPPKHLESLEVLIVDEVSMAGADDIDKMDVALQRAKKTTDTFGGIQLILTGDLFQLPPVVDSGDELDLNYATPFFFSSRALKRVNLQTFELSKVFRQKDAQFIEILNGIRDGSVTESQLALLNTRKTASGDDSGEGNAIVLGTTNSRVDSINAERLAQLPGEVRTFRASQTGQIDAAKFDGLETLHLKPAAQVMMQVNKAPFVNGSLATVESISNESVVVRLNDTGEEVEVGPHTWEQYKTLKRDGKAVKELTGRFTQLPMKLAWAVTVHKSQGKTFDRVHFDTFRVSESGQTYVALSRCRSLDGITLTQPIEMRHVKVSKHALRFHRMAQVKRSPLGHSFLTFVGVVAAGEGRYRQMAEVALIREQDGEEQLRFSTLVNPLRDLGDATTTGIAASQLTLAPTMEEVRSLLALLISDTVVIGNRVIDLFELTDWPEEQLEEGAPYEVGDVPFPEDTAIERAERARECFRRLSDTDRRSLMVGPTIMTQNTVAENTYAVTRSDFSVAKALVSLKSFQGLSAADRATVIVGLSIGGYGGGTGAEVSLLRTALGCDASAIFAAKSLFKTLSAKANMAVAISKAVRESIERAAEYWGVEVDFPPSQPVAQPPTLRRGARVCLSGTSVPKGHPCHGWKKDFVRQQAEQSGLIIEDNAPKKRDPPDFVALIDVAMTTDKAKKARRWNIPVISWKDVVDWAAQQ